MYPNPQDVLPLPPRPNLEEYQKQAKDLVKASRSVDAGAIRAWATKWLGTLDRTVDQIAQFARAKGSSLADAQFVIARVHGFESWPKFAKHLEALTRTSSVSNFESAADAIVAGDVATLGRLLREHPELIRARSTREHRATLLHYISANGVENYRQTTPKNAVEVAEMLLEAGAEVDAKAAVYGGDWPTLGLTATSIHPARAGVQEALMELLLRYGAALDLSPRGRDFVMECLANGCPGAAEFLIRRGAPLDFEAAAALGRLDVVEKASATKEQMLTAFVWACGYGRNSVVDFLLKRGVDIAWQDRDGQTGLHWAVFSGQLETVKLLLARKAPLEVRNVYGGTVLGQAVWSAENDDSGTDYVPIVEALIAAGARVDAGPLLKHRVDAFLLRGKRAAE